MKALIIGLLLATAPAIALAETPPASIAGDWGGDIITDNGPIPIVIHIGDHITFDSPSQKAFGIPATFGHNGANFTINIDVAGVTYECKPIDGGAKLDGTFYQGGDSPKLTLTRTSTTPTFPKAAPK